MTDVEFSPLKTEDLPAILEIYNWYVLNSTATFHTAPVSPDEFSAMIPVGHTRYPSFLILSRGAIAGYCYITWFKKRQAYDRTAEVTIYLKPVFHRQGLGKKALVFLEQKARKSGIAILLGVITGNNEGSISLFEGMGYEKCAHYRRVGEKFNQILDVVSYQKEL